MVRQGAPRGPRPPRGNGMPRGAPPRGGRGGGPRGARPPRGNNPTLGLMALDPYGNGGQPMGMPIHPPMEDSAQEDARKQAEAAGLERIAALAAKHWEVKAPKYSAEVVQQIYNDEIKGPNFSPRRLQLLEFNQYLEKYLWPFYRADGSASAAHVVSLCVLVNEKFREGVPAWDAITGVVTSEGEIEVTDSSDPAKFGAFVRQAMSLLTEESDKLSFVERTRLLVFFINAIKSLENSVVRAEILPIVSLGIYAHLSDARRARELDQAPRLKKQYALLQKKLAKMSPEEKKARESQVGFLPRLVRAFLELVDSIPLDEVVDFGVVQYCERMLEFLIDLQAQLPTRRYTNALFSDMHVTIHCTRSALAARVGARGLFAQLLDMFRFYMGFEINNLSGTALTEKEMTDLHYDAVRDAQRTAFQEFPELKEFALSNVASIDTAEGLRGYFALLDTERMQEYAAVLSLVPAADVLVIQDREFLLDVLVENFQRRPSQIDALNDMPLYPTEDILFDENVVPDEYYSEGCLALPKLNLQFLTLHDYLYRNLNLFRLESTFEIREDVVDSAKRMPARLDADGNIQFDGWARMAVRIKDFTIIDVAKPNLGEFRPSRVRADIRIDLVGCRPNIRAEWDELRKHDIMFLMTLVPTATNRNVKYDPKRPATFPSLIGLTCIRGCEVEGFLDQDGNVIEEGPDKPELKGTVRILRVFLDTNQYARDMQAVANGLPDVYEGFNILLRRKAKENNFKAVLETIRSLMNTNAVVPDWLHDVFLGYGDPASAHYTQQPAGREPQTFNMNDTFLDVQHVRESFPGDHVYCTLPDNDPACTPPFTITFPAVQGEGEGEGDGSGAKGSRAGMETDARVIVTPFRPLNMGPYPQDIPRTNKIRFTPVQVDAIRSAMYPGLTMVVGPPGTGKTDVAVQIVSNWYHNNPEQRTLLVTHSNQALNQLFEKIMALDIQERHLLRLGFGEKELDTEKVFTKYGRVNYVLERRLLLLDEVQRLADTIGVKGDIGYTCETAGYFYLYNVLARWEAFLNKVAVKGGAAGDVQAIAREFPFAKYFENAPQPLFKGVSYDEDIDIAEGCFRHLRKMFDELESFRAFEIMRTGPDRVDYLLTKEAKIIAMTCTHAALKRHDLVKLGFKFDNVLMEEAAQILEVETFIPLMCQDPEDGRNRLKRVVLIGDHHQLPPVIKNMAFQRFSNMEQSMFTRFIRLNVPAVQLNKQGRARSSIAQLYNWRYRDLGDLPHVQQRPEFQRANAGFAHEYQLVDVQDFNGVGESQPNPYFYQNLGEAEYVVATYMYMRLLGYPAEKISIITTYNGQKHLIRDVLNARCAWDPRLGLPAKVTTVDRFQGQQNDYILLSLVRTRNIGHIRDVRRLVVAMSRARLGLYVFGRVSLFENCLELKNTFQLLTARPTQLAIVPDEKYPADRPVAPVPKSARTIADVTEMAALVAQMSDAASQ